MVPGTLLNENVPWETIQLFYLKPFQKDGVIFFILLSLFCAVVWFIIQGIHNRFWVFKNQCLSAVYLKFQHCQNHKMPEIPESFDVWLWSTELWIYTASHVCRLAVFVCLLFAWVHLFSSELSADNLCWEQKTEIHSAWGHWWEPAPRCLRRQTIFSSYPRRLTN